MCNYSDSTPTPLNRWSTPAVLDGLLSRIEFWCRYFDQHGDQSGFLRTYFGLSRDALDAVEHDEKQLVLRLPFPGGYALDISLYIPAASDNLELWCPGSSEPIFLGCLDGHGDCPQVFHWEETTIMSRVLRTHHTGNTNPNWAELLLRLWSHVTPDTQATATRELDRAVEAIGAFRPTEREHLRRHYDVANDEPSWVFDPEHGWVQRGDWPMSTRWYDPSADRHDLESTDTLAALRSFFITVYGAAGLLYGPLRP